MRPEEIADALRALAKKHPPKPRITLQDIINDREPQRVLVLTEHDTEAFVLGLHTQAKRFACKPTQSS